MSFGSLMLPGADRHRSDRGGWAARLSHYRPAPARWSAPGGLKHRRRLQHTLAQGQGEDPPLAPSKSLFIIRDQRVCAISSSATVDSGVTTGAATVTSPVNSQSR